MNKFKLYTWATGGSRKVTEHIISNNNLIKFLIEINRLKNYNIEHILETQ